MFNTFIASDKVKMYDSALITRFDVGERVYVRDHGLGVIQTIEQSFLLFNQYHVLLDTQYVVCVAKHTLTKEAEHLKEISTRDDEMVRQLSK